MSGDGSYTTHTIENMFKAENIQWIFSNALLNKSVEKILLHKI